jgi:hypothetical protein
MNRSSSSDTGRAEKRPPNAWIESLKQARKDLGFEGYVTIGGPSEEGRALYERAKEIHAHKKKRASRSKKSGSSTKSPKRHVKAPPASEQGGARHRRRSRKAAASEE